MSFSYFNSIKVRLKLITAVNVPIVFVLFQFHKGTIKTSWPAGQHARNLLFQFHKGTIKTVEENLYLYLIHSFQFHKGTIKTGLPSEPPFCCRYFNSIKVRLKLSATAVRPLSVQFQFHKGTIKTRYRNQRQIGDGISIP